MSNIPITRDNRKKTYTFYEDQKTGAKIEGIFIDWKNKLNPTKIKITFNNIKGFKIGSIHAVKSTDCSPTNPKACNELQIKGYIGDKNVGEFDIDGECDLKHTSVIQLVYNRDELFIGKHLRKVCYDCYDTITIPKTKNGNILIGN